MKNLVRFISKLHVQILPRAIISGEISLSKMTYFDDLVIHFDKVSDIDYRGKIRFVVDVYVCSSKMLLPA